MALPRKGLRGVEKTAETTAWTNSMAESVGGAGQGDNVTILSVYSGFVAVLRDNEQEASWAFALMKGCLFYSGPFQQSDDSVVQ